MKKNVFISIYCLLFANLSIAQLPAQNIEKLVKHYADQKMFNGAILVAEKGNVIYKAGLGKANMEWNIPNTTITKFRIGSLSKQFTSMLIMQLVHEGKIKLDENITTYLPHYRKETGDKVTIHHLLTHSSGIPNYTDDRNFYRHISRVNYSVPDFVRIYCSADLEFVPGSKFNYSNSGYFILGAIIEAVTMKPYEKQLQQKIFEPLGMKNTGYDHSEDIVSNRAAGYSLTLDGYKNADYLDMALPYAAGSLYSTVEDMLIWDRALYKGKLLPDSLKKKMFTGFINTGNPADPANFKAGYGWFIQDKKIAGTTKTVPTIWHSGGINGFGSLIVRYPQTERLIVLFDNTAQYNQDLIADEIYAILAGEPFIMPKPVFALSIQQKIEQSGPQKAFDFYTSLTAAQKRSYDFTGAERKINQFGYSLLNEKKDAAGAAKIFEINVKEFPKSSNAYDSYAEALMEMGNHPLAIENYKKVYSMDSTNMRALAMVDKMNGKSVLEKMVTVRVDGHDMNLFISGNSGPVIVLEAGGATTHDCWNSIVPTLSKFARVVTYDRPGFGGSVNCSQPRTALRVAEELKEALTKAGIKGPYVIGGWSWGGAFARVFAGKYPSETAGLLLIDPATQQSYARMAREVPDEFMHIMNERPKYHHATRDEFEAMDPTMIQATEADKTYTGKIILLIAGSDKEWSANQKPLKRIWIEELERWAKQRPNTKYEMVESGHFIQREKPAVVINALKELSN